MAGVHHHVCLVQPLQTTELPPSIPGRWKEADLRKVLGLGKNLVGLAYFFVLGNKIQ